MKRRAFLKRSAGTALAAGAWRGVAPASARSAGFEFAAVPVTKGPGHHFFGYYDKCPWDASGRSILAGRVGFVDRQPEPGEALTLGLIDTKEGHAFRPFAETTAWCWQQGTMLQWLGPKGDREVVYNAVEDGRYVAIVRDIHAGKARTLPRPIYALSADGRQAVSLPFDRLARLRPGYGYVALPETFPDDPAPEKDGIWQMDMTTGEHRLIMPIARLAANQPDDRFQGAMHWVNHLQFNPSGTRFVFLHRWRPSTDKPWWTRMYTAKPDGSDLRLAFDDGMVSHFDWRDDRTILAWARVKDMGNRFFLRDVLNGETTVLGEGVLTQDGHCSYSPDRRWVLNDTYPDKDRMQTLMLFRPEDGRRVELGRFHEPPGFTGPTRCDLHPRWNRDGTAVCFDSTHDGTRQMYVVDVASITRG